MSFTCESCRIKEVGKDQAEWEFLLFVSHGPCESCGKSSTCVDR